MTIFEAVQTRGLVDRIRDELHSAILSGRLEPGSVLRESLVASDMGVSRAPVREALRLMEESGLVEKTPNRPYRVASFTQEDLVDLASMRIALEELALRLVVGRQPDLTAAKAALQRLRETSATHVVADIVAADRAFHEALVQAAGNRRLNAAYSRLRDQIELAIATNLDESKRILDRIYERHEDFLERYVRTIREGDPAILLPLLEDHVARGMGVPVPRLWPPLAGTPSP